MQEMYENYEEGEEWRLPDERDPFTEAAGTEVMIGCVEVSMQSLGYVVGVWDMWWVSRICDGCLGYVVVSWMCDGCLGCVMDVLDV